MLPSAGAERLVARSVKIGALADDVKRRLGESTQVKRWLVRFFRRMLKRLEENGEQFTNLVSPNHSHRRRTRPSI